MSASVPPPSISNARFWRDESEAAERTGDYLGACDAARSGLERDPTDRELQYRAILNLSRAGAARRATQLWNSYGLQESLDNGTLDAELVENVAALGARLKREAAFAAPAEQRPPKLKEAAASYEAVYCRTGGTFPAVNAAVLYALSGTPERASEIAQRIVEQCDRAGPLTDDDAYQLMADRATADLLLGQLDAAHADVTAAAKLARKASSLASTRKQLLQICKYKKIDDAILLPLKNRSVLHYTAQASTFDGSSDGVPSAEERRLAQEIKAAIVGRDVGFAYGAVHCSAEIVAAEVLLACGAELNLVLPFARDSFRNEIVNRGGTAWSSRVGNCLAHAGITQATDGNYVPDPEVSAYVTRLAMGMAMLRTQYLATDMAQLVIGDPCNGAIAAGRPGREWSSHSWATIVIPAEVRKSPAVLRQQPPSSVPVRKVRAIIFGDFQHFSRLVDSQMLTFFAHVMTAVAAVLDRYDAHIVIRNTWGDGLYIVFDDVTAAAHCALEIQSALGRLDLASLGLPADLGLRMGLHAGAVFEIEDPVLKAIGFTGTDICRTARIEPGTPPGEVYVTEAFAALFALIGDTGLACEYVGLMNAAKNYGRLRTYVLRRA